MNIAAGKFKAICLKLMDTVRDTGEEVVITKHGKPVAKLVPINDAEKEKESLFGYMKGTVEIHGDIFSTGEKWEADED